MTPEAGLICWTERMAAEWETDQQLYQMLSEFDADDLTHVAVYRGDTVELGTTALDRLRAVWGEG